MKYNSTLGGVRGLTFRQALFSTGFLSDGGLLVPETIPVVDEEKLEAWRSLTYADLLVEISQLYVSDDEIPRDELRRLIFEALSSFDTAEILPIKTLTAAANKDASGSLLIMEMFHGKTWAFKDLALSCVGKFLDYFMKKENRRVIVLVGTSGDTGSAVLEAVRGLDNVDCIVILPRGRCSRVQERQMTTVIGENVHVFRADGSSDDLDVPIKDCMMDTEFAAKYNQISLNSINWARVMIQTAHHFYAYFRASTRIGDQVEIVVPTGAMGNVVSGIFAHKMGLPARYVTAVTADNDVIDRMIVTGDVIIKDDVIGTLATAINIANPYNVQRLVHLFGGDQNVTKTFVRDLERCGKATIPADVLEKIRDVISSYTGNDDVIKQTIRRCYDEHDQYLVCPHTALAVAYCFQQINHDGSRDSPQRICLATASPYKFSEAVTSSGVTLPPNNDVVRLLEKPVKYEDLEKSQNWTTILREKIESIARSHAEA